MVGGEEEEWEKRGMSEWGVEREIESAGGLIFNVINEL